ncbi:YggS family pyridoxal phosphate-dependent enzyme [uncultured Pseudokineococcus sp.]|uniref:YggS family pyridoxal phosphate-dependent enzyme n=1 Tax=uncultured Pseudokineococcus sp. TaxID=1642928 RepID=UPI00341F9C06
MAALRRRVEGACAAVGRDPAGVQVVVTTKTFPASDVVHLAALGVRDVGEAREQEARAKRAEVLEAAGRSALDLRWHFLGRLQRNKAGAVASWAHLVHSCDSERLADALGRGAERAGRELGVLVQADLEGEEGDAGRGGAPAGEVPALADHVAAAPGLRLAGLMAVAPRGADPAASFARLAELASRVRADHPGADVLSAGMSEDLEQAVAAGATHLRVGRAVLGGRPPTG